MQVTVLGSGSAVQFEKRASASYLVETDRCKILLDAGFLLMDRLEQTGVMADEIDAVYISHKHPDHFMGLIHLLFALKNNCYTPKKQILIFGFKGLKDWFEKFREIMGRWIEPESELIFCEDEQGSSHGFNWEIFSTEHSEESTGIILKYKGKKLVYTGDTEYFEKLAEKADGADLFIADCGSGNTTKLKGHMCLNDIIKISEQADIKKILLSHIYPETDPTEKKWSHNSAEFTRSCDLHKISL